MVLGIHSPQILVKAVQDWSHTPLCTASLHFAGHSGGGGVVVLGTQGPHMLVKVSQLESHTPS